MSWIINGTYTIENVKTHTYMELGKYEHIVCSPHSGSANQMWVFHKTGDRTFHIESAENAQFAAPTGKPNDGQLLITTGTPYKWLVKDESRADSTVRFSPADYPKFCIDLKDGRPGPDAPVQLWTCWPGDKNQIWKVHRVP